MEWLLLYPASGYRLHISGALGGIDTQGTCWNTVITDANGSYLRYVASEVQPERYNARAHSFSVRCVQYLLFLGYGFIIIMDYLCIFHT